MWLIPLVAATVVATATYFVGCRKCKHLVLIFWGATTMALVDHLWNYLEFNTFLNVGGVEEVITDSLIGLTMVLVGVVLWAILELAMGILHKPSK